MMKDIDDLTRTLRQFADERNWEKYHSPKNLTMALSVEVAELAEHFQWLTQQESSHLSPDQKKAVREEIADVFIYLVRLADRLEIDLLNAAEDKIALNALKYPAKKEQGES